MSLLLEEQEVILRFDRASNEAVLQVPAAGFTPWRRSLELAGIIPEVRRMDGEIITYTYRFPKTWTRRPMPKRTKKPKVAV